MFFFQFQTSFRSHCYKTPTPYVFFFCLLCFSLVTKKSPNCKGFGSLVINRLSSNLIEVEQNLVVSECESTDMLLSLELKGVEDLEENDVVRL